MKIGEGEYRLIIDRLTKGSSEWKKEIMGEWSEEIQTPKIIYILASSYQMAKNLYYNLFPDGRVVNFRYVRDYTTMMGTRGEEVICSDEMYPSSSFYDRLHFLRHEEARGKLKLTSEGDFRKGLNDQLQTKEDVQKDRT